MAKVTVFRCVFYDVTTDTYQQSRRMGTRDGIAAIGGKAIENSAMEIDESLLGKDLYGMTERDFTTKLISTPQGMVMR